MYLADPFGITPYKSSYLIININQNIILKVTNFSFALGPATAEINTAFFFWNLLPIFHGLLLRVTV